MGWKIRLNWCTFAVITDLNDFEMRKICLLLTVIGSLAGTTALLPATPEVHFRDAFRVLFYNVENFFDTDDDPNTRDEEFLPGGMRGWHYQRYLAKQAAIAKVVVAVGGWDPPALIGLCEVESHKALSDLTRRSPLRSLQYRFVHHESPDARGIDVALLYREERFLPLYDERIVIRFPDAPTSTTRDVLYVKGLVDGADTLHVFVCHFPSRLGGAAETAPKRNHVAMVIRNNVERVWSQHPDANILIMGDFNDYPRDESMLVHLAASCPTEFNSSDERPQLWNMMFPLEKIGKGTHKHDGEWGMLDQIIVSSALLRKENGISTDIASIAVFQAGFLLEEDTRHLGMQPFRTYVGMRYHGGFSDHLPIYIDLMKKPQ